MSTSDIAIFTWNLTAMLAVAGVAFVAFGGRLP